MNVHHLLREHGIQSTRAIGSDGLPGALSMSLGDLARFVNLITPDPLAEGDALARHIVGRPQDLNVGDAAWSYELVPGPVSEAGIEFHAIVTIPEGDKDAVLARLAPDLKGEDQ